MMQTTLSPEVEEESRGTSLGWAIWSAVAAFGAYSCMYAYRKPFTASLYTGGLVWGLDEKTVLVTAQVLGYLLSKILGIRVVSEISPTRRAAAILVLIAFAEIALFFFAVLPSPFHVVCLFLDGLSLGMVFGMVLGFLEGRRLTEAMTASLCASFIIADGVTKSVGTWLLQSGTTERWMPVTAGLLFLPLLVFFVWMLSRIPPPDEHDVASRCERRPMDRHERAALVKKYAPGLMAIIGVFVLVTIARSIRADFAPEIWKGLGTNVIPSTFSRSEIIVAIGVLIATGLTSLIADNRRAFFASLWISAAGAVMMLLALMGLERSWFDAFPFMVLTGLGLYLPYVAIHTTVFERLIAMTRSRGNLGFLMYLADAAGYLGYAAIILVKPYLPHDGNFLRFYQGVAALVGGFALVGLFLAWLYFRGVERGDGVPGEAS